MDNAILFPLMSLINVFTTSPTLNTFFGFSTLPQEISEIWSSPSAPPKSINAPKSVTFLTVPSTTSPTLILANNSFCISSFLASKSCFLSPIILLRRGLNSVITNSISCPSYFVRSFSYTSDTKLAGMNTLVSSTTTLKPPANTCATFAVNTSWFSNASSNLLLPFSAARRL